MAVSEARVREIALEAVREARLITEQETRTIVREACVEATTQLLTKLGIDCTPDGVHETQRDMIHLREAREARERHWQRVKSAAITVCIPALCIALWGALKYSLGVNDNG